MVQQINLIEQREGPSAASQAGRHVLVGVLAVLVVAGSYAGLQYRAIQHEKAALAATRKELDSLRSRQAAMLPDAASMAANAVKEKEIQQLEDVANYLKAGESGRSQGFSQELAVLSRTATQGVWLTMVKLDHAHASLVLEGRAIDASRMPDYLNALRRDPFFAGFSFTGMDIHVSEADRSASLPSVSFRLSSGAGDSATASDKPHPEGRT